MIRVLFLLAPLFGAPLANAADIRLVSRDDLTRGEEGCNIRLQGPIVRGDSDRLIAVRRSLIGDVRWGNAVLCLNSPGGDYEEGLRMAEFVLDREENNTHMMTLIEPGAQCYSACGFIFLAGKFSAKGYFAPARTLRAGGTLGFHAPFIDPTKLPNQNYSPADIVAAYRLAIDAITKAMKTFEARQYLYSSETGRQTQPWVSPSLFAEILSKGPSELFLIDTIGKAGRWSIHLDGLRTRSRTTTKDLATGCDNIYAWNTDQTYPNGQFTEAAPYSQSANKFPGDNSIYYFFSRPFIPSVQREKHCIIRTSTRIPTASDVGFNIAFYDYMSGDASDAGNWLAETFHPWTMYPAAQSISQLRK